MLNRQAFQPANIFVWGLWAQGEGLKRPGWREKAKKHIQTKNSGKRDGSSVLSALQIGK